MKTKRCKNIKCNKTKPITEFHKHKTGRFGVSSICNVCDSKKRRELTHTKEGLITTIYSTQRRNSRERGHKPPKYTLSKFKKWCLSQHLYYELFNAWVESNFDTNLRPSIDRKNDYIGYKFKNIQLMTWAENRDKSHRDRGNGINTKGMKAVNQLTKDGVFINTFNSMVDAGKVTGFNKDCISRCCCGKRKTHGGFRWEYVCEKAG